MVGEFLCVHGKTRGSSWRSDQLAMVAGDVIARGALGEGSSRPGLLGWSMTYGAMQVGEAGDVLCMGT